MNGLQNKSGEKFLEPYSQNDPKYGYSIVGAQIRECFGRVVYSHKTHEKCAEILLSRLASIKLLQIILSALTTASFIGTIFGESHITTIVGLLISVTLLVLTAYTKNYDLGEIAQKHKQAANELWLIREKLTSLIGDVKRESESIESITQIRDELISELGSVYSGAPSTTSKAYKKAQKALQKDQEMTFSKDEINAFLPQELHN